MERCIQHRTHGEWKDTNKQNVAIRCHEKITEMKSTLDSKETPERNPYCENCAYLEQGSKF